MSEINEPVSDRSQRRRGTGAESGNTGTNQDHSSTDRKVFSEKRRKNQMPSKKRSGGNGFVLSKEDIYYLKTHTRYDEKEIK